MTATTVERSTTGGPLIPSKGSLDCATNVLCLRGTIACVDSAGRTTPGAIDGGLNAVGIYAATFDNRTTAPEGGAAGAIQAEIEYGVKVLNYSGTVPKAGEVVFVQDNQTVNVDSDTAQRGIAGYVTEAPNTVNSTCSVWMGPHVVAQIVIAAVEAAELDVAQTAIAAALVDATTAKAQIRLPITTAIDAATSAPMLAFANGSYTIAGVSLVDSKTAALRWNNHATPGAVALNTEYPADLDDSKDVVLHALVSKTGATVGDATKLTVQAYEIVPTALHDADADFGGDTTAVVGNATAKTVTEVTLTLDKANVHAYAAGLCLTVKPKDGTLGTDDLVLHAAWLEYTRKVMTA